MKTTIATIETTGSSKPNSLFRKAKNELSRLRKTVLRELSRCKESGKMVGIKSQALGEGTVMGSVEDIYQSGTDEIVVVKWFDANNIVSQTHLFIEEILSVQPVNKMKRSSW